MTIAALVISVLALVGTGVNLYGLRKMRQHDGSIDWNEETGLATGVTLHRPATGALHGLQYRVEKVANTSGQTVAEAMYGRPDEQRLRPFHDREPVVIRYTPTRPSA